MNISHDAPKMEWYRSSDRLVFVAGDREIGALDWHDGVLKFTGNADVSAHVFFESVLKPQVDSYLRAVRYEEK